MSPYPEIFVSNDKCNGCNECLPACEAKAITVGNQGVAIDKTKCNLCMQCTEICPTKALEKVGRWMSVEDVIKEVERDKVFYSNSGGGVTVSGGEPLMQWQFVCGLLKECKKNGLSTALDTTGYVKDGTVLAEIPKYVDLLLYDIKHMDNEMHRMGTGVSNVLILQNIKRLSQQVRTWLRIPIIPGYNDSESNISQTAEFARALQIEKVSLLPYHKWGEGKYERLQEQYSFKETPLPEDNHLERLKAIVESYGIAVMIGK